jgi:uncharacterized protein YndB with AHSA1/START domain
MTSDTETDDARDLLFSRDLDAPRDKVWRCWTEPELMKRWFTPSPWTTVHAEADLRVGGGSTVVMRGPDGEEHVHRGVYLEVVPGERLVFTDAFRSAWEPSDKPFMTGVVTLEDAGPGRTRYTARIRHWSMADREAHEGMGFHAGWGKAAEQLEAAARSI